MNPTDEEIPSAPAAVSNPPDCPAPTASVPAAPTAAASLPDNAAAVAAPAPPAAALSAAPVPRPRRGRATPARRNQESVGVQVYDFCIMLVVAAIAALLYRRFNIMQTGDNDAGLGD